MGHGLWGTGYGSNCPRLPKNNFRVCSLLQHKICSRSSVFIASFASSMTRQRMCSYTRRKATSAFQTRNFSCIFCVAKDYSVCSRQVVETDSVERGHKHPPRHWLPSALGKKSTICKPRLKKGSCTINLAHLSILVNASLRITFARSR